MYAADETGMKQGCSQAFLYPAGGGTALLYASKGLVDGFKERGQLANFDQQVPPPPLLPSMVVVAAGDLPPEISHPPSGRSAGTMNAGR